MNPCKNRFVQTIVNIMIAPLSLKVSQENIVIHMFSHQILVKQDLKQD